MYQSERHNIHHWWYNTFKAYLRLVHETLMVRHRYTVGAENIPEYGDHFFITSNHQNTANDPLNIVFALPLRWHVCAMARANVFEVHPLITRFLHYIGLLPAYRFGWEGGEGLEHNFHSFDLVAARINGTAGPTLGDQISENVTTAATTPAPKGEGQGGAKGPSFPVIVFPEAGHTQGHWLDPFTTGTVRMAFHAAKAAGWQHDIKLLPTAHHYADYFDVRADFMWMVAPPISLQPYYAAYQEHPNSTMRTVTRQLRETIHSMMLDEGADDYDVKDFLRLSAFNPIAGNTSAPAVPLSEIESPRIKPPRPTPPRIYAYTRRQQWLYANLRDAVPLPERLAADKRFIDRLCSHDRYADIIRLGRQLMTAEQHYSITDLDIACPWSPLVIIGWAVVLIALLPLWIISLWPHAICYSVPPLLLKTDKMFRNSYRYILSVLVLYPLAAIITITAGIIMSITAETGITIAGGITVSYWLMAVVWVALWLPLGIFCHWHYQHQRRLWRAIRALRALRDNSITQLRQQLQQMLQTCHVLSE